MTVLRKSIVLIPRYEKSKHLGTIFEDFKEMSYLSRRNLQNIKVLSEEKLKAWKFDLNGRMRLSTWSSSIGAIQNFNKKLFARKPPSRSHLSRTIHLLSMIKKTKIIPEWFPYKKFILQLNFDHCIVFVCFIFPISNHKSNLLNLCTQFNNMIY